METTCGPHTLDNNKYTHSLQAALRTVASADRVWTWQTRRTALLEENTFINLGVDYSRLGRAFFMDWKIKSYLQALLSISHRTPHGFCPLALSVVFHRSSRPVWGKTTAALSWWETRHPRMYLLWIQEKWLGITETFTLISSYFKASQVWLHIYRQHTCIVCLATADPHLRNFSVTAKTTLQIDTEKTRLCSTWTPSPSFQETPMC